MRLVQEDLHMLVTQRSIIAVIPVTSLTSQSPVCVVIIEEEEEEKVYQLE